MFEIHAVSRPVWVWIIEPALSHRPWSSACLDFRPEVSCRIVRPGVSLATPRRDAGGIGRVCALDVTMHVLVFKDSFP
jgi:hypothetical protein